jgi:hypothetical protein
MPKYADVGAILRGYGDAEEGVEARGPAVLSFWGPCCRSGCAQRRSMSRQLKMRRKC